LKFCPLAEKRGSLEGVRSGRGGLTQSFGPHRHRLTGCKVSGYKLVTLKPYTINP
jgi:hypothetical protein